MDDKQKQERLEELDVLLVEVREQLELTEDRGENYELRALQLLLPVVKAMHSTSDVYALIAMILDSALAFAEADRAFLMLFDAEGLLRFKMGRSADRTHLGEDQFVISTTIVQEALDSLKPIILADAQRSQAYSTRQSIQDLQLRTIMAAPLHYQKTVLGLLYVDSTRPLKRYTRQHLSVLGSLADQAAVAIHNAQKFETQG